MDAVAAAPPALALSPSPDLPALVDQSADARSVRLLDPREHWRKDVRHRPPAERERWLSSPEGVAVMGKPACDDLLKGIRRRERRLRAIVPSGAWLDAWRLDEIDIRDAAPGMVLSTCGVRDGIEGAEGEPPAAGPPTERLTPPIAVAMEDMLDGLKWKEACWYDHPPSPSAEAIRRIGETRAAPKSGRW